MTSTREVTIEAEMLMTRSAIRSDASTTSASTTDMKSVQRTRSIATAVEADIIDTESQMRTATKSKAEEGTTTDMKRGIVAVATVPKRATDMRGVREIKMMNKAHPVLLFLLLCSLCLTLVRIREVTELELT